MQSYEEKNNHIVEFIEENKDILLEKTTQTIFSTYYWNFCNENGYKQLGKNIFYEAMANEGYIKSRNQSLVDRPYMFILEK